MAFGFVRRHPVWTWIALVLLFTGILVLAFLPRAIKWGLERWLEQQGPISVFPDRPGTPPGRDPACPLEPKPWSPLSPR